MTDRENNGLEVTVLKVDQDLPGRYYRALMKHTSDEKRNRIGRYHFYEDAQNALLSDILVRFKICKRTGMPNRQLVFSANDYGKPYLANDPHIQYNLSHSGKYIAFAIDTKPVGIDVEQIHTIDLQIAERFFHYEEINYIMAQSEELQTRAFFKSGPRRKAVSSSTVRAFLSHYHHSALRISLLNLLSIIVCSKIMRMQYAMYALFRRKNRHAVFLAFQVLLIFLLRREHRTHVRDRWVSWHIKNAGMSMCRHFL